MRLVCCDFFLGVMVKRNPTLLKPLNSRLSVISTWTVENNERRLDCLKFVAVLVFGNPFCMLEVIRLKTIAFAIRSVDRWVSLYPSNVVRR